MLTYLPTIPSWLLELVEKHPEIRLLQRVGFGMYDWMKAITPYIVDQYLSMTFILDDIQIVSFEPDEFFRLMQVNNLTVAQPSMEGTGYRGAKYHPPTRPRMVGRVVQLIEIQMVSFTPKAWACQWELIDLDVNNKGWGIDLWCYGYCSSRVPMMKMGTIDVMKTAHRRSLSIPNPKGAPEPAWHSQEQVWKAKRGIDLQALRCDLQAHVGMGELFRKL